MDIIKHSFQQLFPEKGFPYQSTLEYNRRLADFNANILCQRDNIKVHLNLQWKDIDEEIKIGLIQHLLCRAFKVKRQTYNIELYHNFIKNIPTLTRKTKSDPILEASFQRNNQQFFQNTMEQPNLQWGSASFRKLASYSYHTDTITVSTLFQQVTSEILDYLLYHEMLHKQFQFKHANGRLSYHSPAFKKAEKLYPHQLKIEQELAQISRKSQRRQFFPFRLF